MRNYAAFFEWPDQANKERAIVRTLSGELSAAGQPAFNSVESVVADPPDCLATTEDGRRFAVEVTELVDEETVQRNQRTPHQVHQWEASDVIARIQAIIARKDGQCSGLRGYHYRLLVIHTDEPWLQTYSGDRIWSAIKAHTFAKPKNLDEVVVLVSYDARTRTYPLIPLAV